MGALYLPARYPSQLADALANPFLWDDFAASTLVSGGIGSLGWGLNASTSGVVTRTAPPSGHAGVVTLSSGATASSYPTLSLWNSVNVGPVLPASGTFDFTWLVALEQSDVNTLARVGMAGVDYTANPPDSGVYFERLGADTDWFSVVRAGGAQTRTDTAVATTTGWIRLRIRYIDATHVGFTCGAGAAEVSISSANMPIVSITPFVAISNNATAAAKLIDLDFFALQLFNLART